MVHIESFEKHNTSTYLLIYFKMLLLSLSIFMEAMRRLDVLMTCFTFKSVQSCCLSKWKYYKSRLMCDSWQEHEEVMISSSTAPCLCLQGANYNSKSVELSMEARISPLYSSLDMTLKARAHRQTTKSKTWSNHESCDYIHQELQPPPLDIYSFSYIKVNFFTFFILWTSALNIYMYFISSKKKYNKVFMFVIGRLPDR